MAGKGALGAALTALGTGVTKGAERTYSEQLNERIAKGKQSREDSLLKRREIFQTELAEKQHKYRVSEIETTQAGRLKTATDVAKIKATAKGKKPHKFETFKIGSKGKVIGGELVKNSTVKAYFDPNNPETNIGLGPGMVMVTRAGDKDTISDSMMTWINKVGDDYHSEQKELNKQEQIILTIREMLKKPDALKTHVLQNQLASLLSNSSRAIAEVEAYKNLGTLQQRVFGGLKKFTTGKLLESQYSDIEKLIDNYSAKVLPKFSNNLNDHYLALAKDANIKPSLILRKSLLAEPDKGGDVGTSEVVPLKPVEKEVSGAPKPPLSAAQIDADAKEHGWSPAQVNTLKSKFGFTLTPEGPATLQLLSERGN